MNINYFPKTMAKKTTLNSFFYGLLLMMLLPASLSYSQCNSGAQLDSSIYTPNYSGYAELVTLAEPDNGIFTRVNVLANRFYTFYTYQAGAWDNGYQDYVTITDDQGNFLDFGPSPLQYRSYDYSGVIRYYIHSNSACQTNTINKSIYMMSSTSVCLVPFNLNATNIGSNTVTLNWDAPVPTPDNAYQYYIAPENSGAPQPPTNTASTPVTGFTFGTSVTLNNLSPNKQYYWWVRSGCGSGHTVWAQGGSFTTTAIICNQPTGFTVSNITANSALFTWQAPNPIPSDGYNFAVNLTGTTPIANDIRYPLTTSQFVSPLASNTTYYYFVRSDCGNVESPWVFGGSFTTSIGINCNSATYGLKPAATFTPTCTGSPETILSDGFAGEYSNVAVTANKQFTFASSIATDYISITNAAGSVLYASGITPVVWTSGASNETVRFFLHTNSSCGTNTTNRSRTVSCTPYPTCLPPSALTSLSVGSNVATISWTASASNPSLYDVYFSTSNAAPNAASTPNGNIDATAATINNLSPATTYYFWVRSNCNPLVSAWVSGGSFTTTASIICNTPSNITKSSITSSSAQINWTAASPAPSNGYQFYYNASSSTPTSATTPSGNTANTNTTLSGLNAVTTYYIWVRSNCGTSQSAWVSGGSFTTTAAACNPPSGLTSSAITSNNAQIDWIAASPAPNLYDVYFSTSSVAPTASTTPVGSLADTSANLINLTASTTYYFWVRSNCGANNSAWISGGNFTTAVQADCTDAVFGLYPSAAFTPACTGSLEDIVLDAYAGEYALVNILSNKQYTFTSSVATDHITITNEAGTVVYTRGTTPLVWQSGANSGVIRYYFHANSSCAAQNTNRTRSITCTTPVAVCTPPTSIVAGSITNVQATLQWSAVVPAPQTYQYYISTSNTPPTSATASSGSSLTTTRVVTGLSGNTTYYFWGRCFCGSGGASVWVPGGSFTTLADGNCTEAVNGLLPSATFVPACTGVNEQITAIAWASEYSNVAVSANKEYTFTSSTATDYVTITNAAGTIIYSSGTTPLVWQSGAVSGTIRYYLHTNIACGVQNVNRVKSVKCTSVLGVEENQWQSLQVFPNPTTHLLHIANDNFIDSVSVYNMFGQLIKQQMILAQTGTIDMSGLAVGTYFARVVSGNTSKTLKVVKE